MTHTHMRDAYGDPIAEERYTREDGTVVDTYGDEIPEEQFAVVCDDAECPESKPAHPRLPSGFSYADEHQQAQFAESGMVNGASKVCLVGESRTLAVRLHPPKNFDSLTRRRALIRLAAEQAIVQGPEGLDWYKREYNAGFAAGKRGSSRIWEDGVGSHAWDDGYLDARAERPKWHLAHCVNHDTCGEG